MSVPGVSRGLKAAVRAGGGGQPRRCGWCSDDPLYVAYHDEEWGVPSHDDRHLFEMLILEGAQAGLSWITILRKRQNYRAAFDNFDVSRVARYTPGRIEKLLANPGIVRNRLKVGATIGNAHAVLRIQDEFGSLDRFVWPFVDGKPRQNAWPSFRDGPARTTESDALSKALRERGCKFAGSTITYAFMQAVGMVNDHEIGCYRYWSVREMQSPG
ncbi:MAG: DNA-3-methyladenine glycosylase I [Acidobacteriota bacterium]